MKYIISELQYKNLSKLLLFEGDIVIKGCNRFQNKIEKNFCKFVEKEVSLNLSEYSEKMKNLLIEYFNTDSRINDVVMEKLSEKSDLVKDGFKEIDEVVKLISSNCESASSVANKLKAKWLSKYSIYFKDSSGVYHPLNRLNTNYTAIAVIITIYYKKLLEQLGEWFRSVRRINFSNFVKNWIDHFFNKNHPIYDPRRFESAIMKDGRPLESTPNASSIFNKVLKPKDFYVENSEFQEEMLDTLDEVRAKGFETENFFEELLIHYKIEYKKYNSDFSFVDMILGIDFLIRERIKRTDNWIPVQVKSSFNEKYNLVDQFECTIVMKPELITINGKKDFSIGGVRGFENYFCRNHGFCEVPVTGEKKKVYASPAVDYLSSREYLDS